MAHQLLDVRVRPPDLSPSAIIKAQLDAMIAAPHPPTHADIAQCLDRRTIGLAMTLVANHHDLSRTIGRTSQRLLPFVLAVHFSAIKSRAAPFDITDLRKLKTAQARLALAALGESDWQTANLAERRVAVARLLLLAVPARSS